MKKLFVDLKENSYNIFIEKGLIDRIGEKIKEIYNGSKVFIITDKNVTINDDKVLTGSGTYPLYIGKNASI